MGMSGDTALSLAKSYVKKTLQGQGALKGQDGFSPTVKENPSNTDNDYRLDITDKNGTFTTPNLKADNNYIAETYATKVQVDELKSDLVKIDSELSIPLNTNDFVGYGCNVSVNNNELSISYSGEELDIWICGATKKQGRTITFDNVEFYAIGKVVIGSNIFVLAICNSSSNFGCLYAFNPGGFYASKITNKVINGTYTDNSNIELKLISNTEIKVNYNGSTTNLDITNYSVNSMPFEKAIIGYLGFITNTEKSHTKTFNNEPNYLTLADVRLPLSNWKGKVGYALGDSITYYNYYQPLVKEHLGLVDYINGGHGGFTIGDLRDRVILDMKGNIYDFITVFAGTNDFGKNKEIGTNDSTSTLTTKGGTNALIDELLTDFPTTPIMFILPLQRDYFGTESTEISGMVNSLGLSLRDYVNAIKEVCELRGFPVLDMYSLGGLKPHNVHEWTIDGLHPNQTYWNLHYKLISDFINTQYPIN